MARYQRGWLRVVERKQGRMWQLHTQRVIGPGYPPCTSVLRLRPECPTFITGAPLAGVCFREAKR